MSHTSTRPLVPRTERSSWDTAIRLCDGVDLVDVLTRIAQVGVELASRWDCTISVGVEPEGDACDTGHFVDLAVEQGVVWAGMTPWPGRFGGAVPHQLDLELELAGWVLLTNGADPHPIDCLCQMPEFMTPEQQAAQALPARRLVAVADDGDIGSWANRVVSAAHRILAPRSSRWFLYADATALMGGVLSDHASNRRGVFYGQWTVDLGQVLAPTEWEPAVWPAYSEAAYVACENGLHQYHEPPCASRPDDDSLGCGGM